MAELPCPPSHLLKGRKADDYKTFGNWEQHDLGPKEEQQRALDSLREKDENDGEAEPIKSDAESRDEVKKMFRARAVCGFFYMTRPFGFTFYDQAELKRRKREYDKQQKVCFCSPRLSVFCFRLSVITKGNED